MEKCEVNCDACQSRLRISTVDANGMKAECRVANFFPHF